MAISAAFPFPFTVNSSLILMRQLFQISTSSLALVFAVATAAVGPLQALSPMSFSPPLEQWTRV